MTLSKEFVLAYLGEELQADFGAFGFHLLPERHQFRREEALHEENIFFSVSVYEDLCLIDALLGIRVHELEEIIFPFLRVPAVSREEVQSLLIAYGKLLGRPYLRLKARDVYELDYVCEKLRYFLRVQGRDFFHQNKELWMVDLLLNTEPTHPSVYCANPAHRYIRGIAAAYLNQNAQYHYLGEVYQGLLLKTPGGDVYVESYQALVQHLERNYNL